MGPAGGRKGIKTRGADSGEVCRALLESTEMQMKAAPSGRPQEPGSLFTCGNVNLKFAVDMGGVLVKVKARAPRRKRGNLVLARPTVN